MQHCDSLISASWCITVEPSTQVLANYSVAVHKGQIIDLLPTVQAKRQYQADNVINRPGHVLIPGLINSHTQAAVSLFRGLGASYPANEWLGEEMVRDGTALAIAEMLRGGITCFSDMYYFPDIVAETAIAMHMRTSVGMVVCDKPSPWAENPAEYLNKAVDLIYDQYAGHLLVNTHFAVLDSSRLNDDTLKDIRIMADQVNAPVQLSLHRTLADIEASIKLTGKRPLTRLSEAGLLNSTLRAGHALHLNHDEIESLAAAHIAVALCPQADRRCNEGRLPYKELRAAGIRISIGTDNALRNNVLDMFHEMRAVHMEIPATADDLVARASQLLRMATIDGATSLGIADKTGSIEKGKQADLICIDLQQPNSQPVHDPLTQLVYTAQSSQVTDTWVAGRQLLNNGEFTLINESDLLQRSAEWQKRVANKYLEHKEKP